MGNPFKKPKPQTQQAKPVAKPKPVVKQRAPVREAKKDDVDPKRRRGYGGGGAAASGTIAPGRLLELFVNPQKSRSWLESLGDEDAASGRKTLLGD